MRLRVLLLVAALLPLLGGCDPVPDWAEGRLRVVASFYPLEYVAERVGGSAVDVRGLTKPGAEPHDLELTPRAVADVATADLVVYLSDFQPAVDAAVQQEATTTAYDVAPDADLDLTYPGDAGSGGHDPHFWLDPTRLAAVGDAVADRMAAADPAGAVGYQRRAAGLRADLDSLDDDLSAGLRHCRSRVLVTSHDAFGYLARRYGLEQVGISGPTPDAEPVPSELAAVTAFVESHGVRTIYSETLASPAVARTVARETGARTAVLDPVEGLTDESAGSDYLEVMRSNLATLRAGQDCR